MRGVSARAAEMQCTVDGPLILALATRCATVAPFGDQRTLYSGGGFVGTLATMTP